jgi:hypothetical protein
MITDGQMRPFKDFSLGVGFMLILETACFAQSPPSVGNWCKMSPAVERCIVGVVQQDGKVKVVFDTQHTFMAGKIAQPVNILMQAGQSPQPIDLSSHAGGLVALSAQGGMGDVDTIWHAAVIDSGGPVLAGALQEIIR